MPVERSPFGTGKCERCENVLPQHICFSGEFKLKGSPFVKTKHFCCFECLKAEKSEKKYTDLQRHIIRQEWEKKRSKKVASSECRVESEAAVEKKNT